MLYETGGDDAALDQSVLTLDRDLSIAATLHESLLKAPLTGQASAGVIRVGVRVRSEAQE